MLTCVSTFNRCEIPIAELEQEGIVPLRALQLRQTPIAFFSGKMSLHTA